MPNIAAILKIEISRVARKEVRIEVLALKKAVSAHRSEIAAQKRRIHELERQVQRLVRSLPKAGKDRSVLEPPATGRFSAKGLASQRRRLGLSAADCGLLVGASAQSIYNWETGNARPRAKHLAAIAVLKTLGKKAAMARLQSKEAAG